MTSVTNQVEFDEKIIVDQETLVLPADCNQARELAKYAHHFIYLPEHKIKGVSFGCVDPDVFDRLILFHTDSVLCGVSALALQTAAPTCLRSEALDRYKVDPALLGALVFGSEVQVSPEKAIVANCSAVREWDSNGTLFGFRPGWTNCQAGEFGHNDYYPVVLAAAHIMHKCQKRVLDGRLCLRAMLCLDEIRGRLAEAFSLRAHKIDHVLYGAIASAIVYGTLIGASIDEIESSVGMAVAHYTPWRAIRAGTQLSDSKGASAALSTEAAIMSLHRSMMGFSGPKDIFRNPEAPFRLFSPTDGNSPFEIVLTHSGGQFAVAGMHFKLGLYEHQSASAIHALFTLMSNTPALCQDLNNIKSITVSCYEPAVGIIGDQAKRNPTTRQSADHSMLYIISTLLRKANEQSEYLQRSPNDGLSDVEKLWLHLMLLPEDYTNAAIQHPTTRALMERITFKHGGPEFDRLYPDGLPTQVEIEYQAETGQLERLDSGMISYPMGHARHDGAKLERLLMNKFTKLGILALDSSVSGFIDKLQNIQTATSEDLFTLYNVKLSNRRPVDLK